MYRTLNGTYYYLQLLLLGCQPTRWTQPWCLPMSMMDVQELNSNNLHIRSESDDEDSDDVPPPTSSFFMRGRGVSDPVRSVIEQSAV